MQTARKKDECLVYKRMHVRVSEQEGLGQQFKELNMSGVKCSGQLGGVEEEDEGSGGVSCRS